MPVYVGRDWLAGWLVELGLAASGQSISVYVGPSPREREEEKKKMTDKRKKHQNNLFPHLPYCKDSKLLPYHYSSYNRTPRH